MSNVVQLNASSSFKSARESACLWVVRLSAGITEVELGEIEAWLDESPDNARHLMEVADMWDQVSVLSELSDVFPLEEYRGTRGSQGKRRMTFSLAAIAASAVLVFQTTIFGWFAEGDISKTSNAIVLSYETRIGQQSTVILPDGSEVLMNTNSQIDVSFSHESREIFLRRGEGHFNVTKDSKRPFKVHANGGVVEAVGTAFTVNESNQAGLEITVVEGIVNFTRTPVEVNSVKESDPLSLLGKMAGNVVKPKISLTAGESVRVDEAKNTVEVERIETEELENRLAWRNGMLQFQGDPLGKVIQEVSRYTQIRIDVDDAVRDIEVLGYFRTGDIEGVLLTMKDTFHVRVERLSDTHIVLKPQE